MKRKWLIVGALSLVASVAAGEYRQGSVVHVTEADDGRSFRATVGLEIRARIAQPAGTDLRWEVRNDPHLALIERPQSEVAYGTGMGRGRNFRVFRLRIVRPGRFPLVFGLLPPRSAGNQAPSQRIVMNVDSAPSGRDDRWTPRPDDRWNDRDAPDTVEPLTEQDADQVIDIPTGQKRYIALPSNASTGFHWSGLFEKNVRIYDDDIREERPVGARIGAGGTSLIPFRVLKRGLAEITLMYLPPGGGRSRKTLTYRFRGI